MGLFCICLASASATSQDGESRRFLFWHARMVDLFSRPTIQILAGKAKPIQIPPWVAKKKSGAAETDVVVRIVWVVPVAIGHAQVVRIVVPRAAPQAPPDLPT